MWLDPGILVSFAVGFWLGVCITLDVVHHEPPPNYNLFVGALYPLLPDTAPTDLQTIRAHLTVAGA
jgi:hypothetical protein